VLNLVGRGDRLPEARDRAYAAVAEVGFEGAFCRRDIAARGIRAWQARDAAAGDPRD
jgi:phosphoribosylamine--glycine ligase